MNYSLQLDNLTEGGILMQSFFHAITIKENLTKSTLHKTNYRKSTLTATIPVPIQH